MRSVARVAQATAVLNLSAALSQLVMGETLDPDSAYQYGYALSETCCYKGTTLDVDYWGAVRWAAIEECGLEKLMTETGPPVPLPEIDDFPAIGHIRRSDLHTYLDAATKHRAQLPDDDLEELMDEYIQWLHTAKEKNLDLVFVYH